MISFLPWKRFRCPVQNGTNGTFDDIENFRKLAMRRRIGECAGPRRGEAGNSEKNVRHAIPAAPSLDVGRTSFRRLGIDAYGDPSSKGRR
jgi:hypothetical protein